MWRNSSAQNPDINPNKYHRDEIKPGLINIFIKTWFYPFGVEAPNSCTEPGPQPYSTPNTKSYKDILEQNNFYSMWLKVCGHPTITQIWICWTSLPRTMTIDGRATPPPHVTNSLHSSGKSFCKVFTPARHDFSLTRFASLTKLWLRGHVWPRQGFWIGHVMGVSKAYSKVKWCWA